MTERCTPPICGLRRDPCERGHRTSNTFYDWMLDRACFWVPAKAYLGRFRATVEEYPPRQEAAHFSLERSWRSCPSPAAPGNARDATTDHRRATDPAAAPTETPNRGFPPMFARLAAVATLLAAPAIADPLLSWADTDAKARIVGFVDSVTGPASPD